MPGTLHVVATPIGNLEDITLRAIRVLREADLIAAEDTRRTARLLSHYGIETPMLSYHEHNHRSRLPLLLKRLADGDTIALVTDAGTPGISDPGTEFVDACITAGIAVNPIPGASALLAAASAAGFNLEPLTWLGFAPTKSKALSAFIASLADTSHAVCFLETPHRITATLTAMGVALGDRPIFVARELTKTHQELLRGTASEVQQRLHSLKGEFTIIVSPKENEAEAASPASDAELVREFGHLQESGAFASKREVAAEIARRHGRAVREVYELILKQKSADERPLPNITP